MVINGVHNSNGTTTITVDSDALNVLFNAVIIAKEAVNSDLIKYVDHPKFIAYASKLQEEFKYFYMRLREELI